MNAQERNLLLLIASHIRAELRGRPEIELQNAILDVESPQTSGFSVGRPIESAWHAAALKALDELARAWESSADNLTNPDLRVGTNEQDARMLRACARQLRECVVNINTLDEP